MWSCAASTGSVLHLAHEVRGMAVSDARKLRALEDENLELGDRFFHLRSKLGRDHFHLPLIELLSGAVRAMPVKR